MAVLVARLMHQAQAVAALLLLLLTSGRHMLRRIVFVLLLLLLLMSGSISASIECRIVETGGGQCRHQIAGLLVVIMIPVFVV